MDFSTDSDGNWSLSGPGHELHAGLPTLFAADGQVMAAGGAQWREPGGEDGSDTLVHEASGIFGGTSTEWHIRLQLDAAASQAELQLEIVNPGPAPVQFSAIDLFGGRATVELAGGTNQGHWLQGGFHMLGPWQVHTMAPGHCEGFWILGLFDRGQPNTLVMGFADYRNCLAKFAFDVPLCADKKVDSLSALLHPGATGPITIEPGGRFRAEPLFIASGAAEQAVLGACAERLGRDRKRPLRTVRWVGWNTYYNLNIELTQQDVIEHADIIAARFLPENAGRAFVLIDHGWQQALGDWEANDQFPEGMQWLAAQLNDRGLVAGIWLNLFQLTQNSQLAATHPEWLLKNADGEPVRVGKWFDQKGLWDRFCLDISHPGARRHLVDLVTRLTVEWGYRVIKSDFNYSAFGTDFAGDPTKVEATFHDSSQPVLALYLSLLEELRAAMGEETYTFGCIDSLPTYQSWSDAQRISYDTGYKWPEALRSIRSANTNAFLSGHTWATHPDMLLLQPEPDTEHLHFAEAYFGVPGFVAGASLADSPARTLVQARVAATHVAMSGGPVVSSDLLTKLPEDRWAVFEKIVPPIEGPGGKPVDLTASIPTTIAQPVAANGESWHLLAVYNWSKAVRDALVRLEDLGLDPGAACHAFEFWSSRYQCVTDGRLLSRDMAATSVRLYAIRAVSRTPQLVGTDRHYSQGAAEFASVQWQAGEMRLELGLSDHVRQPFQAWLWCPAPYRVSGQTGVGDPEVVVRSPDGDIIRGTVDPADRLAAVTFER
ncbi:MAG: alpha-galactosidase [Lentisphaeria bacterium]|jgi:hypothetical protein|nr:alpha-galactosidase [Lentisphaeria bacterium]